MAALTHVTCSGSRHGACPLAAGCNLKQPDRPLDVRLDNQVDDGADPGADLELLAPGLALGGLGSAARSAAVGCGRQSLRVQPSDGTPAAPESEAGWCQVEPTEQRQVSRGRSPHTTDLGAWRM